ncbi:hypothetical protein ACJMK2_039970 [Sinanodonta woodiana]|uniref:ZP domain-containing protein n=1 Tax=Sinanodonta woodiana TaxID=1069815 RepID=A0ABD3WDJ5_SINWO
MYTYMIITTLILIQLTIGEPFRYCFRITIICVLIRKESLFCCCSSSSEAQAGSPISSSELLNIVNPIRLDDVQCVGNETSIFDCPARPWNQQNCGPMEWAKVSCLRLDRSPLAAPLPLLQCNTGRFTASFSRSRDPFLEPKHLSIGTVYNGTCTTNKTLDPNYVVIIIPFNECGTLATTNVSHIYYENLIRYNSTNIVGNIVRGNTYMITVLCEFPKYVLNQQPIVPLTETVSQRAPGQLAVSLIFYQNNSFTNPVTQSPLQLTLGEYIYAMLILTDTSYNIRLVVSNCIATPSTNKSDAVQYPLFQNKCEKDATVAFFPLNNTMFGFWFQTFKFVNFDTVYIHCDGLLCLVSENSAECDRSCNATDRNRRRRRHSFHGVETSFQVSSAPVYVFSKQANEQNRRENDVTRLEPLATTKRQSIITLGTLQNFRGGLFSRDSLDSSDYASAERRTTVKTTEVLISNPISLPYSQPPEPFEANVKDTSMLGSSHVGSANGLTFQNDQSDIHDHDSSAVRATGNKGDYSCSLLMILAMMHVLLTIYLI